MNTHGSSTGNTNANVITTMTMNDGTEVIIRHRDSFMGWVNACRRNGINPRDVASTHEGMPESSRVAS